MNCALFFIVHFIELVRMSDLSDLIDKLDDDGILHSADSTAFCGSGAVGASSPIVSSSWVPFTGLFFNFYRLFFCLLLFLLIRLPHFLVGYSFGTVGLCIIITKMRDYVSSHGGFQFDVRKYYFSLSGRSVLYDVPANSYLDTNEFDRCPQSISFECREIWERKGFNFPGYAFCIRVAFDRSVGAYIVNWCRSSYMGHVVNLPSIVGHVRYESNLSVDERIQLADFGKICYISLQSKTALCRLFSNRTYDPNMVYRVVKKARNSRSCQSLYDFIQLSLINTTKEPKRSLNNKHDLKYNCIRVKKKRFFWDCKRFLI